MPTTWLGCLAMGSYFFLGGGGGGIQKKSTLTILRERTWHCYGSAMNLAIRGHGTPPKTKQKNLTPVAVSFLCPLCRRECTSCAVNWQLPSNMSWNDGAYTNLHSTLPPIHPSTHPPIHPSKGPRHLGLSELLFAWIRTFECAATRPQCHDGARARVAQLGVQSAWHCSETRCRRPDGNNPNCVHQGAVPIKEVGFLPKQGRHGLEAP